MLSPAAIDLLLQLLEAPEPVLSGEAFFDAFPAEATLLKDAGILVPDGYEMSATAIGDGDWPVTVIPDDGDGFFYFSSATGLVTVDPARLVRHRVDFRVLCRMILPEDVVLGAWPGALHEDDLLIDIGRIEHLGGRTNLVFARRLSDPEAARRVAKALDRRSSSAQAVVITSTAPDRLWIESTEAQIRMLALGDLLASSDGARLELADLLLPEREGAKSGLKLSADSRVLTVGGLEITLRGSLQRKLIRLLVDAHYAGQRVRAKDLLEEVGSGATSFRTAFGPSTWKMLRRHLKSRDGLWSFDE